MSLSDYAGWWDARRGTDATIPNIGTAGAALDATVTGLDRVEGPAVWFPGTPGNTLTCPTFTIPSTLGVLTLPFTDAALTISVADVAALSTAATSFTASTGQTVTVNRTATAGSAKTTIVPHGAAYINTDPTVATNRADITDNAALHRAASVDTVLLVAFTLSGAPSVAAYPFYFGTNTGFMLTNDAVLSAWDGLSPNSGYYVDLTAHYNRRLVVAHMIRDGQIVNTIYDDTGAVIGTATAAITADTASTYGVHKILQSLPGHLIAAAYRTGLNIAPSDTELAALAVSLLAAPDTTTYPTRTITTTTTPTTLTTTATPTTLT